MKCVCFTPNHPMDIEITWYVIQVKWVIFAPCLYGNYVGVSSLMQQQNTVKKEEHSTYVISLMTLLNTSYSQMKVQLICSLLIDRRNTH